MDSEEEEWAKQYGIKGIDLPTGDVVYLGMVVIAADQEETLSFMDPSRERHLEYDISRAISKVLSPKKPKIGVLSGLEIFGNPPSPVPMPGEPPESPPWYFLTELRKSYDVVDLSMSSNYIDNNLDLLILVYTKYLSEPLQYAVDQYVLNGGRLIIFVDPFALSDRSADFEKECTFDLLFKNWGISMDSQKALIDFGHATQYMDKNNQIIENPFWLTFDKNSLNQDNIITGQLESLLFAITGVIQKDGSRNIQYDPLVTSSEQSQLISRFKVRQDLNKTRQSFQASGKKYDVAVFIKGSFDTAFPGGPPPIPSEDVSPNKERPKRAHLTKSLKESNIMVVADTDMINDNNYIEYQNYMGQEVAQIYNDNLNFLLNACELMTGNPELINIRSRGQLERSFTRVLELEKEAQTRWISQEQELSKKFEETNKKLKELESQKDASQKFVISEEQETEIKKFRDEKIRINKELKIVKRNLRSDIERLGLYVKFTNIFLMPLLVAFAGVIYAVLKRKKSYKKI
jgi:ABC-type uncharacterized transport system involved in gliding motility auxiliary subunit